MTEQEAKPKWLLELENRKRKPKLAHETGAGAPCITCESACPGLDLHFWRKICKNCKCRGDDHDVDDDDFPQFELLFGPNMRNKKNRSVVLRVNDKKQMQTETAFEWIPPDTTKELAADYMKALPSDKMPIKGSAGAALRRQQLQKQLPLHDIDHKACDGLSDLEQKEFEKYLDKLKNCAGQGKVSKLMTIKPFDLSLMTPANATDVQRFSPQHSQQLTHNGGVNLRTPSSFISKVPQSKIKSSVPNLPSNNIVINSTPLTSDINIIRAQHLHATNEINPKFGQYHPAVSNIHSGKNYAETAKVPEASHLGNHNLATNSNKQINNFTRNAIASQLKYSKIPSFIANEECVQSNTAQKVCELNKSKTNLEKINEPIRQDLKFSNDSPSNALFAEKILSEALLPPSAINASDIVGSSLDEKGLMYIREKLNDKYSYKNDRQMPELPREVDRISHYPSIANSEEIKICPENIKDYENKSNHSKERNQLPSQLPYTAHSERLKAEINTSLPVQTNVIHSEKLNNPVFPQDAVGASFTLQNPENINQLQQEMEGMAVNVTKLHQCHKCTEDIHCGDVVITAEKIKDAVWHPGCFVCSACNELLVDLVYFTYKGNLYCARDLAELLEIPRCFACDELIFVREYTVAEGHNYHVKHFCCWDCDIPLAGQQYISENDRPLCLPCYQKNYANTCNACNSVIAADQQGVAIKNLNFHATDSCFCCFICKKSLLGGQIAIKENKPLCSKECISEYLHSKNLVR